MSKIEVNKVGPQCGTTVTVGCGAGQTVTVDAATVNLGRSGGTVALACGATQTGFGRTGTVDWQTTPKTGDFTGANGEGYFINTTSGTITMTLPSASAGHIISIQDYNNTFDANTFKIQAPSGVKINGGTASGEISLSTEGQGLTLVYVDSTVGWRSIESTTFSSSSIVPTYIAATGGNTTLTVGDFKTHIFTGPGTFCVSAGGGGLNIADYIVVAGGGGGASPVSYGGGGGGGGFRISNSQGCIPAPTMSPLIAPTGLTVAPGPYPIVVGAGGAAGGPLVGTSGGVSTFSTITSAGGGGGAKCGAQGGSGGSGGGGSGGNPCSSIPNTKQGGAGNTPPVSPPQGNNGGAGNPGPQSPTGGEGGGGGGAGAVGSDAPGPNAAGPGGAGSFLADSFVGPTAPSYGTPGPVSSTRYFAGGAGGGTDSSGASRGSGGDGGGGQGAPSSAAGTVNTGGGGGGSSHSSNPPNGGSAGGSGIVMIRYKFQ